MENILTAVDPTLILHLLTELNPEEHFTHYLFRFGGGKSLLGHVDWSSSADNSIPVLSGYFDVNMILMPRVSGKLQRLAQPHLPVQPTTTGVPFPAALHVDLCASAVSSAQPPLPYNQDLMSVLYLTESRRFPGCVDTFEIVAGDGQNETLPACVTRASSASSASSAAAAKTLLTATKTNTAAGKKRKATSKGQTAHTKKKAKRSKKEEEETTKSDTVNGAKKKPVSKVGKGEAASAAKKKSPPKESAAAGSKLPSNKNAKLKGAKAKKTNHSSSSKSDSPSIPRVISSKKTAKITPKKGKATTTAKDSAKKPSATEAGGGRAPSVDKGNEMVRLYEEAMAKENTAGKDKNPSKSKSKESGDSTKTSSSKKTKEISNNDEGKSSFAVVDNNRNIVQTNAAEKEKTPSRESADSTKSSSGKKTNGSSSKKDAANSNERKSTEKPLVLEGEDPSEEADTVGPEASKRRMAPTDARSSDAPKSPSRKEIKTSKANEASPSKVTFAADVKKSDGSKKADPGKKKKKKKKQQSPVKKSKGNVQKQKLVHCGICIGCKTYPCRKCSACTDKPKRRCNKRPCTNPRFVPMAEYEAVIGLV